MTKVSTLRSVIEKSLLNISKRTDPNKRCIILSGGVDTCAILAAAKRIGVTFVAAFTVITGEDSPDKDFAIAAAKEHKLAHHVLRVTSTELIENYLPACVRILHTFDGMTLRNSLVVAAAFKEASKMGFEHAVVGDGADELFGGYSFMWGCENDPQQWKGKRDKMCQKWTFATAALATYYGLVSHSPFTEPSTVQWALQNTERSDCIGSHAIKLVYHGESIDHVAGKMILREAYTTVASWRRKDPIEVGSGITVIGHDPYWSDLISDEDFEKEKEGLFELGYTIKNKEHLANLRCFVECFGLDGSGHPTKKRYSLGEGCVGCCFEIGDETFCDVCGAFPAQRKGTLS